MAGVEVIIKTDSPGQADDLAEFLRRLIPPFLPDGAEFKWAKGSWYLEQDEDEEDE